MRTAKNMDVRVDRDLLNRRVLVAIFLNKGDQEEIVNSISGRHMSTMPTFEGEHLEPSLSLPQEMALALLEGLAAQFPEWRSKSVQQIHVESAQAQGELKATKEHLNDMRRIVFKGEKNDQ